MATTEDVENAVNDAVVALAGRAKNSAGGELAANYGRAAKELAEAYAWLVSPTNPH
ncbi:MAG: hypothetical protein JWP11_3662 [Frankiales bacterium]|nr:hypothetical protein [Frankiales bacterium]